MKVIIVGGVAGGASAAARLRRLDESAEIILLERGAYISYANCGLPYYIGGEIRNKEKLTVQTPESFRMRFSIDVRIEHEVVYIDTNRKTLTILNRISDITYEESYDKLLLSPGSEPVVPNLPGIIDERIFTLRTVPDTLRIHSYIHEKKPEQAVIVGGGFIGLEMAENLIRAGLSVTVVEFADHVIGSLDIDMASDVHRYLRYEGVQLLLGRAVQSFSSEPDALSVHLDNGNSIKADLVLLSVGVRPDTKLAQASGIQCNAKGGIIVDEYMQTSHADIYAVGDAVEIRHHVTGLPDMIPLAGPANKQGRIAADNIYGIKTTYKGTQGSAILKIFEMTVASTGLSETALCASGLAFDKIHLYAPAHATYYPDATNISMKILFEQKTGRILGAQLVGFDGVDKRCDVLAVAIRANMTAQDLTELELCYAPPYSSAKDPVNLAGYAIENIMEERVRQFHWHDIEHLPQDAILLDVRMNDEYNRGYIPGAIHIPLDTLRDHLDELDVSKAIYVYCQVGLRGYIASRILTQNGYRAFNLSGGYRLYEAVMGQSAFELIPTAPCGRALFAVE